MPVLAEWDSFYGIVGSAAGTLIGLQFVAMTLVAQKPVRVAEAGRAFATPTIVHFGVALLLSALLRAPWQAIAPPAVLWGFMGLCGVAYVGLIARRVRRHTNYRADWEDWSFHVVLPLAAYAALGLSSFAARAHTHEALFAVGVAILVLLFTGIHNAWDAVAYHVFFSQRNTG
jgi:hypothetical protein